MPTHAGDGKGTTMPPDALDTIVAAISDQRGGLSGFDVASRRPAAAVTRYTAEAWLPAATVWAGVSEVQPGWTGPGPYRAGSAR